MADDVTIKLGADTSSVEKSLSNLKSTLIKVGAAAAAAFAGKKVIDAAVQQEKAINALNQALIRAGDYSKETSEDMQRFASDLQEVTTIGDEATLELLALAKSFGVSNEEAKKLVTTAADASVALGVDARTALEQLGGTLSGTSGRLAKFVPEVKELGIEALKNGEAIDIFAEKFAGAAKGELQTFAGAAQQLSNTFGDLLEEIGFFITKSPIVISAIKGLKDIFSTIINFLKENGGTIREVFASAIGFIVTGFGILVKNVVPPLIDVFLILIKVLDAVQGAGLDAVKAFAGFNFVQKSITTLTRAVLALADVILENLLGAFESVADFVGVEIPGIEKAIKSLRSKIEDLATVDTGKAFSDFIGKASDARDAAASVVVETLEQIQNGADTIDFDKLANEISAGLKGKIEINPTASQETEKSFLEIANSFGSNVVDTIKTNIGSAASNFGKQFLNIITQGVKATSANNEVIQKLQVELASTTEIDKRRDIEKQITEAQEAQIKAQKDAAFGFTSELGGFIADTFLPGAGQFVKLFLELAKDPEAFKQFIEGFVEQLPVIINALAEAIPVIFEVIAENADKILIALANGIVKIAVKAVEGVGRAVGVLLENAGREFFNLIGSAGEEFVTQILKGASDFINKIVDEITGVFEGLDPTKGGGTLGKLAKGDVGGALEDIGGALGFAQGGIVPQGFPNDSGLAKVSSGEMVLNDRQQQNLFNLLDRGGVSGGSQMITVNLVMNEEILASQILELNRDNQRIA